MSNICMLGFHKMCNKTSTCVLLFPRWPRSESCDSLLEIEPVSYSPPDSSQHWTTLFSTMSTYCIKLPRFSLFLSAHTPSRLCSPCVGGLPAVSGSPQTLWSSQGPSPPAAPTSPPRTRDCTISPGNGSPPTTTSRKKQGVCVCVCVCICATGLRVTFSNNCFQSRQSLLSECVSVTHLSGLSICGNSHLQHSVHLYIVWVK